MKPKKTYEYIQISDFKNWHPQQDMASNSSIMLCVELDFTNETYTYIVKRYGEIFVRTKDLGTAIAVFNDKVTNLIGDLP